MSFREFADGNGDTARQYEDDGRVTHLPIPHWNAITQLESREDDVLVCAYPKSGTHWMWEIVDMLKSGRKELTPVDMKERILALGVPSEFDKLPSPRVFTTHRQFHDLPSDFIINKRKLVLVVRDPRDICVSYYNFMLKIDIYGYTGKFDGYIDMFLKGRVVFNSWSRWILSYEKGLKEHPELPYHVVYYEQMKQDPVKEIGRLAKYLGVDPSVAATVAEKTQFSAMKSYKPKFDIDSMKAIFKDNKANEYVYRKGESGDWKEWFSEEQLTHFNDTLCEQLGRSSIQPLL